MLLKLALRNLLARRLRALVVGSVVAFGSFLAVLGGSFVTSLTASLRSSLTRSIVGDIQVYSDQAKDAFSLFGSGFSGMPDIGHIANFLELKKSLMARFPEIRAMVPQGVNVAMYSAGNILDVKLAELRKSFADPSYPAGKRRDLEAHLRAIVAATGQNYRDNLVANGLVGPKDEKKDEANLARARNPAFWAGFDGNPDPKLEFLENNIAPLIFEDHWLNLMYMGTIPHQMQEAFPQIQIVRGRMIPQGSRGILINEYVYQNAIKDQVAVRLDQMRDAIRDDHQTFASSEALRQKASANVSQVGDILTELSPSGASGLEADLNGLLGPAGEGRDLRSRLKLFFDMDDGNFQQRYGFFYRCVAPRIVLYRLKVGDVFPLTSYAQSGFSKSVNMKIWGTFRFSNFEHSPLAGVFNLMDMASFRDLYGFITPRRRAEQAALEAQMLKEDSSLDESQKDFAELFTHKKREASPAGSVPARVPESRRELAGDKARQRAVYSQAVSDEAMEDGPCLNAAIVLKSPDQAGRLIPAINAYSKSRGLGVRAVGWEQASGVLGQIAGVVKWLLTGFIAIIFLVGAFIIQNAMFMATMERTVEIGTMRAIGAKRDFIQKLIFAETAALSIVFSALGVALGLAAVLWLGRVGIPAPNLQMSFLFSGSRLYLRVGPAMPLVVLALTVLLSLGASLYPAWRANQVAPIRAMQHE